MEDDTKDAEPVLEQDPDTQDEDETEAPTVAPEKLAGGKLALRLPGAIAERWDLYLVSLRVPAVSYLRVYAAAIALCWPDLRKTLAKNNIVYAGDILQFGGVVQEILFTGRKPAKERVNFDDFRAAGRIAVGMISDSIVSGEAVEAKRDF